MSRAVRFSQTDLSRAIKAFDKAGLCVSGAEIKPDGTIRILTGSAAANDRVNPLDRLHG